MNGWMEEPPEMLIKILEDKWKRHALSVLLRRLGILRSTPGDTEPMETLYKNATKLP